MTVTAHEQSYATLGSDEAAKASAAAAFGLSAAITVVFNVVLAFIKDSIRRSTASWRS